MKPPFEWGPGAGSDLWTPWNQGATVTANTSQTSEDHDNCDPPQRPQQQTSAHALNGIGKRNTTISQTHDNVMVGDQCLAH